MPVYEHIVKRAKELGCEEWIETLNNFEDRLNNEEPSPSNWYLTDLRHLYNLASPHRNGYMDDSMPIARYDALVELGDDIIMWLEDVTGWEEL